ncbi:hypothetical protein [Mycoplasmopsis verecunda]|uniref:Uncharacterized protein n=1 Tax=Mycoplasmopsis verecunda TaxID=171291 RepID=A0A1T4KLD3_9BACT|nr:hypothetical protein [Mycoplasmopsis verecunda]WPB54279.1 hypothetical protein SAM46_02205 [Mycoplasmopsis verecunda]SJZ43173.1 hypothetical protein SAMN02745154_00096 [Mycoplasmopsis verecunda]
MNNEVKLFEIYEINDELKHVLFQKSNCDSRYAVPIFSSNDEILFCEVISKSLAFFGSGTKQLPIFTSSRITNLLIDMNTIYKISKTDFDQYFKNVNHEILRDKISEINELEILDTFVQCVNENLMNTRLITINSTFRKNIDSK